MSQYSIDDVLVLDTGDDPDRSAATATDLDIDVEDAFEPLRPSHGGMTLGGCADFCVGDGLDAFTAPGWRDEPAPAVVWCQDAMVAGLGVPVPLTLGFGRGRPGQGGQPRDEIHRRMAAPIERHLGRAISVRSFQRVDHLSCGAQ